MKTEKKKENIGKTALQWKTNIMQFMSLLRHGILSQFGALV